MLQPCPGWSSPSLALAGGGCRGTEGNVGGVTSVLRRGTQQVVEDVDDCGDVPFWPPLSVLQCWV